MQRQLQDASGVAIPHLAIWLDCREGAQTRAARADDELADAPLWICPTSWILRCEPLVVVVMPIQYDIGTGIIERLPERLRKGLIAVLSGAETRMVPVGEGAGGRMSGEIGTQPLLLRRARLAAAHRGALGVEYDNVPRTLVVGVVAFVRIAGSGTKVVIVASRA